MYTFLISIHVVLCISLIGLVLLQHGKGADMGATFGSGSNTVFGAGGAATVVTRITTGLAIGFMVTSVLLARFQDSMVVSGPSSPLTGSVLEDEVAIPVDDVAVVPRPDTDAAKANPPAENPDAGNLESGKPAAEAAAGEQPKAEVAVPQQPAAAEPVAKTEAVAPAAVAAAAEPVVDAKKPPASESRAEPKTAKK